MLAFVGDQRREPAFHARESSEAFLVEVPQDLEPEGIRKGSQRRIGVVHHGCLMCCVRVEM